MENTDLLVIGYFWLALSGAVAVAARWRRRSEGVWFIASLLASPIVAAAYLFAMPPEPPKQS
jgi:hypothetical protein